MEKADAVAALAALAQDNRLDVFRLLVQAGQEGMPAGEVAGTLKLAPNTLTFHFDRLRGAGLVTVRREGRSMIYAARYETMNALLAYPPKIAVRAHPHPARRHASPPGPGVRRSAFRETVYVRALLFMFPCAHGRRTQAVASARNGRS